MYFPFSHFFSRMLMKMKDFLNTRDNWLWNTWKKMSHAVEFLLEEARRHMMACLSVQTQTSNYLNCFLWETQHPTTQGDESCDFFLEGLHHCKEIHSCVSQQMHILFSSRHTVCLWIYFRLSTLLLLFFKNKYEVCNLKGNTKNCVVVVTGLISGERIVASRNIWNVWDVAVACVVFWPSSLISDF